MKIRDILQEKATLIAIPLSKFNMFFNNYILKKIANNTLGKVNADNLSSVIPIDVETAGNLFNKLLL